MKYVKMVENLQSTGPNTKYSITCNLMLLAGKDQLDLKCCKLEKEQFILIQSCPVKP